MLNNKIKVFARIKPPRDSIRSHIYEIKGNKSEHGGKKVLLLHGVDEKYLLSPQQKLPEAEEFLFENIFTEITNQETIYNSMAKPVVARAIEGFNGTIMAYGQTGTGKTHTICGGRDKGIIPRAFKDVFHSMKEMKQCFKVFLSVMEIYNEHAYDLLNDRFTQIGLRRDKTRQVTPRNLKTVQVSNMHQLDKLLRKAWNNRIVGETPMNDASSRSHCIFSLHLHQLGNGSSSVMISKVHMIDLSGSEKLGKKRPSGILLNETRHINLSLHYIELVIRALSDKNRDHIPYRNSMITSFLRDSLGGNSNTVMVFTLSLDPMFFEETVLTCRFAQRVSLISNKMKKQISQNNDMELIKDETSRLIKSELEPMEFEPDVDNMVTSNNHKGITCKLDMSSESSTSSCQCDSDKMSIFDDEDLSKYVDELLSEEDLSSLHYCYEKHQSEERDCIIELNGIERSLTPPHYHQDGLVELTKAFKLFSPNMPEIQNGNYYFYEQLGLCLQPENPLTGKLYSNNEKEEFFKFASRILDINKFKKEYYDEYCDLLVKEYHATSSLDKYLLCLEKSRDKLNSRKALMNSEKINRHERHLQIKECKMKEKQSSLEDIKSERIALLKKVEDLRRTLTKQFHEEWLPEKENALTCAAVNNADDKYEGSSTQLENSEEKLQAGRTKRSVTKASKTLGKSKSNTTEYRTHNSLLKPTFRSSVKKMVANTTTSETKVTSLSRESNDKDSSSEV